MLPVYYADDVEGVFGDEEVVGLEVRVSERRAVEIASTRRCQELADFQVIRQNLDVFCGRQFLEVVYLSVQRLKGEPWLCVLSGAKDPLRTSISQE